MKTFKVNDRVKRAFKRSLLSDITNSDNSSSAKSDPLTNLPAGLGTVKALKEETSLSGNETVEETLMVQVAWDNGTISYLALDSLEGVA